MKHRCFILPTIHHIIPNVINHITIFIPLSLLAAAGSHYPGSIRLFLYTYKNKGLKEMS